MIGDAAAQVSARQAQRPVGAVPVGPGAGQHAPVPAARGGQDGPGVVLEHPSGEVAPGPVVQRRGAEDGARRPAARPAPG